MCTDNFPSILVKKDNVLELARGNFFSHGKYRLSEEWSVADVLSLVKTEDGMARFVGLAWSKGYLNDEDVMKYESAFVEYLIMGGAYIIYLGHPSYCVGFEEYIAKYKKFNKELEDNSKTRAEQYLQAWEKMQQKYKDGLKKGLYDLEKLSVLNLRLTELIDILWHEKRYAELFFLRAAVSEQYQHYKNYNVDIDESFVAKTKGLLCGCGALIRQPGRDGEPTLESLAFEVLPKECYEDKSFFDYDVKRLRDIVNEYDRLFWYSRCHHQNLAYIYKKVRQHRDALYRTELMRTIGSLNGVFAHDECGELLEELAENAVVLTAAACHWKEVKREK